MKCFFLVMLSISGRKLICSLLLLYLHNTAAQLIDKSC